MPTRVTEINKGSPHASVTLNFSFKPCKRYWLFNFSDLPTVDILHNTHYYTTIPIIVPNWQKNPPPNYCPFTI